MVTRREMLGAGALGGAALLHAASALASQGGAKSGWDASYSGSTPDPGLPPGEAGKDYQPVVTPNGKALPFKVVDGWKVFHLVAEEVQHTFAPGLKATCWGYNGRVHGPTLEAVEGDRVRIYVTNKLKAPTTVHWHGLFLPNGMDGVAGLTQPTIQPGETFRYEFPLRQHGTYMYHSHHDEMTQMAMGMLGMIVIHPRKPSAGYRVDRDFAILLSEWSIKPGTSRPDPNAMSDFNVLTMNGKAYPGTKPLVCKTGDRVRIRFGNLSAMDHHPIHLHGHYFKVVATDGGVLPASAQWPEATVLVPVGSTRDVEFIADAPGDWAMHCHMTHHVMNQMSHGLPSMVGVTGKKKIDERAQKVVPGYSTMGETGMGEHPKHLDSGLPVPKNSIPMKGFPGPFDYIGMGGMFTIVKVRDGLASYKDPGWYAHPAGTVSSAATPEELARDGITP
jgi:manganese oxidase